MKKIFTDRFPNIDRIKDVKSPTFIIHGKVDKLIPASHSEKLYNELKENRMLVTPEAMDHNNFDLDNDFINPLSLFMNDINYLINWIYF